MTVSEFFSATKGSRQLVFSENEKPLCGRDFWGKYRDKPEWHTEIAFVRLIPTRAAQDGLWFDGVTCIIKLAENKKL